jgi:hypothetical protein
MTNVVKILVVLSALVGCTPDYDLVRKNLIGSWYAQQSSFNGEVESCITYSDNEQQTLAIYRFTDKKTSNNATTPVDHEYMMAEGYWYLGQGKRLQHIAALKTTMDNRVVPEESKKMKTYSRYIIDSVDAKILKTYKKEKDAINGSTVSGNNASSFERIENCDRFANIISALPKVDINFVEENYAPKY